MLLGNVHVVSDNGKLNYNIFFKFPQPGYLHVATMDNRLFLANLLVQINMPLCHLWQIQLSIYDANCHKLNIRYWSAWISGSADFVINQSQTFSINSLICCTVYNAVRKPQVRFSQIDGYSLAIRVMQKNIYNKKQKYCLTT